VIDERSAINPTGPTMMLFVREGDRWQKIMEAPLEGENEDVLRAEGLNRLKLYSQVQGPPRIATRCDKEPILKRLPLTVTGSAQEIWDQNQQLPCSLCGRRHRAFLG